MKVTVAKTFWEKSKGLLGTNAAYPLLLKTRWGIHSVGMKYPIDVVVLDNTNKIVKLKQHLLPNCIFFWNPTYDRILELPPGSIKKEGLRVGEKITLVLTSLGESPKPL